MRRGLLALSLLLINLSSGDVKACDDQHFWKKPKCSEGIEFLTDSIHYFKWNGEQNVWENSIVEYYLYDGMRNHTRVQKDFNSHQPIYQSIFMDWTNDLPYERYDQLWIDGQWENKYRSYYDYNEDNLLKELIIQHLINDAWVLKTRRTYSYNHQDQLELIDLDIWKNELWQEYSYQDFIYSAEGQLVEMNEFYIGSEEPWRRYKYSYNEFGLVEERLIQVDNGGIWENEKKYTYAYDEYGFLKEFYILMWDGEDFKNEQKRIYHNRVLMPRKVQICHKGKTICVSYHSLKAHLAHGDYIGKCDHVKQSGKKHNHKHSKYHYKSSQSVQTESSGLFDDKKIEIYPIPAREYMTIDLNDEIMESCTSVEILDMHGRKIKSFLPDGKNILRIDCTGLDNGLYFIHVHSDFPVTEKVLIQR